MFVRKFYEKRHRLPSSPFIIELAGIESLTTSFTSSIARPIWVKVCTFPEEVNCRSLPAWKISSRASFLSHRPTVSWITLVARPGIRAIGRICLDKKEAHAEGRRFEGVMVTLRVTLSRSNG